VLDVVVAFAAILVNSRQLAASSDVFPRFIEPPRLSNHRLSCETSLAKHGMSRNVVMKYSCEIFL
jgi:hypothetical protein